MEVEKETYPCNYPECNSVFGTRHNLRRHVESIHLCIKKFECDFCGLKLASKQTKQEHTYIHTGERPFECSVEGCNRRFRQSSQLSSHMKQHRQNPHPQPAKNTLPPCNVKRQREQEGIKIPRHPDLNKL